MSDPTQNSIIPPKRVAWNGSIDEVLVIVNEMLAESGSKLQFASRAEGMTTRIGLVSK